MRDRLSSLAREQGDRDMARKLVYRDRMSARPRLDTRTVRRGTVWTTVPATRQEMSSWRAGSSYVTTEVVQ